jgi:hypothetical protein
MDVSEERMALDIKRNCSVYYLFINIYLFYFVYYCSAVQVRGSNDDCVYAVFVSYIEIYNNNVYDLLETSPLVERGEKPRYVYANRCGVENGRSWKK